MERVRPSVISRSGRDVRRQPTPFRVWIDFHLFAAKMIGANYRCLRSVDRDGFQGFRVIRLTARAPNKRGWN